jgi:hypothetical protein
MLVVAGGTLVPHVYHHCKRYRQAFKKPGVIFTNIPWPYDTLCGNDCAAMNLARRWCGRFVHLDHAFFGVGHRAQEYVRFGVEAWEYSRGARFIKT